MRKKNSDSASKSLGFSKENSEVIFTSSCACPKSHHLTPICASNLFLKGLTILFPSASIRVSSHQPAQEPCHMSFWKWSHSIRNQEDCVVCPRALVSLTLIVEPLRDLPACAVPALCNVPLPQCFKYFR